MSAGGGAAGRRPPSAASAQTLEEFRPWFEITQQTCPGEEDEELAGLRRSGGVREEGRPPGGAAARVTRFLPARVRKEKQLFFTPSHVKDETKLR